MEHTFEYESWSDYKDYKTGDLRSRIESEKKQIAKDFFKKRITGEEASDMFTDDEEFKQEMREMFFGHGCNTKRQLDFLLTLDFSKSDLKAIFDRNEETIEDLEAIKGYKGYREPGFSEQNVLIIIDNVTSVNSVLKNLI